MPAMPSFAQLAASPEPPLDALALALASEFRQVDHVAAMEALDTLGAELAAGLALTDGTPPAQARACADLLGTVHGFAGDTQDYDHPDNSMLDLVLGRRRGLPILLSVVYVEVGRRAGVPLAGVGLPGHFVVGHFGGAPPILLDPFAGGAAVEDVPAPGLVRPWRPAEIAMRMLNNLFSAFQRRSDLSNAIRAARMRLALPAEQSLRDTLRADLISVEARLN